LKTRLEETLDGELRSPFFAMHEGVSSATARIGGRELLNFSSYNYLGLSGHPEVTRAAQLAASKYGTSVSASRIASGERPVHAELESALAAFLRTEGALVFVGGHATNVSVLSHLFGPSDIVLCDALIHNSALQGAAFSGARWLTFPHNDWAACDSMLSELRGRYRRAVIVVEGAYSADGDVPDLRRFVEVKARHGAMLMVDEAHSLGVLGATGRGIVEEAGMSSSAIDIHMGTLSKSLASCGGYIAGSAELVSYLKYTTPGFIYSVGITPPNAGAALAALRVLEREPARVTQLRENALTFARAAREAGLDIGAGTGAAVIPVIVGDSLRAVRASQRLFECGVNVQPMISPAVANDAARLRFFISSEHTAEQIQHAVRLTADVLAAERQEQRGPLALA
jgi:8-amino-7-oxononanoate synthase